MIKIFRRIERRLFMTMACVILMLAMNLTTVFAATANIIFDNSPYSATYQDSADENANKLSFDVSINCDEKPGTYYLELVYDTARLQYTGGADREEQGVLVLEGTATSNRIVYTLNFDVKSGGNAGIYVQYADITSADGNAKVDIATRDYGTITIQGTDISGAADFGHNVKDINSKIPFLGKVSINDIAYYITDQSQYIPDTAVWTYTSVTGTYPISDGQTKDITYLTGTDQQMHFLYLMDSNGLFHLYAVGMDGTFYPCVESDDYFYVSALAGQALPDGMTVDDINENDIVYLQYKDGTGKFVFKNSDGDFEVWSAESLNVSDQTSNSTVSAENGTVSTENETNTTNETNTEDSQNNSDKSSFIGNLSPRFIIVILAILFVIVLIVLLAVKSGGKNTGVPKDKEKNNNNQKDNIKKDTQNNKNGITSVAETGENKDDAGQRFDDDIDDLFSGQEADQDDSLAELEKSLAELDSDAVNEQTDDVYHEEEMDDPSADSAKTKAEESDMSLIERLREIQDEPGVTQEDSLSFTTNLKLNLEELSGLLDQYETNSEEKTILADEHAKIVSALKNVDTDEDEVNFEDALEKALEESKYDI